MGSEQDEVAGTLGVLGTGQGRAGQGGAGQGSVLKSLHLASPEYTEEDSWCGQGYLLTQEFPF